MNLGLDAQYVLVTGSSRGIGKGIAEAFLQEKAHVIITGRDKARLEKTRAEFTADYGDNTLHSFAGDLQTRQALSELASFIMEEFGQLNHLICNIGSGKSMPPLQEDMDEFQRMLDVNLLSAVAAVKEMSPLLETGASRGRSTSSITFIGSICGMDALGCPLAYSSAKAALESYAGNIARLLAGKGIRVNTVSPGNIIFPGSTWEDKLAQDRSAVEAMLAREVPMNRLGTLGEVANVAVFLASSRASFVTGANWVVDGGQTR